MTNVDGIVHLGLEHHASAADVLAQAFVDDPVIRYVAQGSDRLPVSAGVLGPMLLHGLKHAYVWSVVEEGAIKAVAIWFAPSMQSAEFTEHFDIPSDALARMGVFNEAAEAVHARAVSGPHWHLEIIGVAPKRQRHGLGTRLVRHGMAFAAKEDLPVYLNTTSVENVALYSTLGFRVMAEEQVDAQLHLRGMVLLPPVSQRTP